MDGEAPKLSIQLTTHGKRLELRATAQPGEARVESDLPPQGLLANLVVAAGEAVDAAVLEFIGRQLRFSLWQGDVGSLAQTVFHDAARDSQSVHLELRFDPDQAHLASYPWELLVDEHGRPLIPNGLADVTRYITYPHPAPSLNPDFDNLPLLRAIAQPTDQPAIQAGPLPLARIETLEHVTFEAFQHRLLLDRLSAWGFHFDGHGSAYLLCTCGALHAWTEQVEHPTAQCRCGKPLEQAKLTAGLAFEREGHTDFVASERVGEVLSNTQICQAMILACESARVGGATLLSGLAPGLVLAGVPAVIGTQFAVTDSFANAFARNFYRALLNKKNVLTAMHTARRMIARGAWYSPVMYLRARKPIAEGRVTSAYHTRNVDTAVPVAVRVGKPFLVRLWIRRPETPETPEEQLRGDLGVPPSVRLSTLTQEHDLEFKPVEGRELRRGEVEVDLGAGICDVEPASKRLFVDEYLDAPPAIFRVTPRETGPIVLIFEVKQQGALIATVTHQSQAIAWELASEERIATTSHTLPLADVRISTVGLSHGLATSPILIPSSELISQETFQQAEEIRGALPKLQAQMSWIQHQLSSLQRNVELSRAMRTGKHERTRKKWPTRFWYSTEIYVDIESLRRGRLARLQTENQQIEGMLNSLLFQIDALGKYGEPLRVKWDSQFQRQRWLSEEIRRLDREQQKYSAMLAEMQQQEDSVQKWRGNLESVRIPGAEGEHVVFTVFSPDGRLLASVLWDGAIRLWQVSDGTLVRTLEGRQIGRGGPVTFSPDGRSFAAVTSSGIVVWNTVD